MPATLEPTTFNPSDVFTAVSLDLTNRQIQIPVILQNGSIVAPPCAVPAGSWTLVWSMASDAWKITSIEFPNSGAKMPDLLTLNSLPTLANGFQCSLTNNVLQVNSFNYTIFAQSNFTAESVRHDPSIAVVQDPIVG